MIVQVEGAYGLTGRCQQDSSKSLSQLFSRLCRSLYLIPQQGET